MEQNAFKLISEKVGEALSKQGFTEAGKQQDSENRSVLYTSDSSAYSVVYDKEKKHFELRSCDIENGKPNLKWKSISVWLFDADTDDVSEAGSISNDFVETIEGPKQTAQIKKKKKRKKDDENNPDPVFFFNRFVGVFPELRDEMNQERALYGDIRAVSFSREHLLPKLEELCTKSHEKEKIKRCCDLLNDMYVAGDMDVRSIITIVLLNGIKNEAAIENMKPNFSDELQKAFNCGLKFKGKTVKPEKKKKKSKLVAENLNDIKR